MTDQAGRRKNIYIDKATEEIIRNHAEYLGLSRARGFSPALRIIVREWDRDRQEAAAQVERDLTK